jgi:UDP-2,3-diacylglucosamine hydrolase
MIAGAPPGEGPLAIICGGGTLPFVVAEAAQRRGRRVLLFPIRHWADAARVAAYPHHWVALGQFGSFCRIASREGCRDVVMIGALVRPSVWQIRPDFTTLRLLPRVLAMFRGGDNHLLTGIAAVFEEYGFRLIGAHEVAPEILMPEGYLGTLRSADGDQDDVTKGLALLATLSPHDVGQAVVVARGRVLALEAAEGTDAMLRRVAEMRANGRVPGGRGVLVKAAKHGQDRRMDLPSIGPLTIEGAARAGLAGIAVVAGSVVIAEPERLIAAAEREGLFVLGARDLAGSR